MNGKIGTIFCSFFFITNKFEQCLTFRISQGIPMRTARTFRILINQCPSRACMYVQYSTSRGRAPPHSTAVGVSVYMHTLSFEGHVHRRGAHSIPVTPTLIRWLREVRAARGTRLGLREKGVCTRRNDGVVDGQGREKKRRGMRKRERLTEEQGLLAEGSKGRGGRGYSTGGGKWVRGRRNARGCRCTAEPTSVDATATANPSNGRRLHSLPLLLFLSMYPSPLFSIVPLVLSLSLSLSLSLARSLARSLSLLFPPATSFPSCYPSILVAPSVNDLHAR